MATAEIIDTIATTKNKETRSRFKERTDEFGDVTYLEEGSAYIHEPRIIPGSKPDCILRQRFVIIFEPECYFVPDGSLDTLRRQLRDVSIASAPIAASRVNPLAEGLFDKALKSLLRQYGPTSNLIKGG